MRHHLGSHLRRTAVGAVSPVAHSKTCGAAGAREAQSISEPGRAQPRRVPAYADTLGHDADAFALGRSIGQRGSGLGLRMTSRRDTAWTGVLCAAVDARP
ncbi:hypothetical protein ACFC18_47320 [Streptomyces sp. NPDC056121]|uniref:hypothetical protein n=1 Tax=Streptomyces TaxID=1883 RepID=UPI001D0BB683|nr:MULTISPECIES: hypothetical protein [Streptomyces]MCX5083083.1 hypothetical protein [Streptomyces sp. NBC_00401]UDM01191.1 hypothetical protein LGI35_24410 [Streptomyces longhuiensis]